MLFCQSKPSFLFLFHKILSLFEFSLLFAINNIYAFFLSSTLSLSTFYISMSSSTFFLSLFKIFLIKKETFFFHISLSCSLFFSDFIFTLSFILLFTHFSFSLVQTLTLVSFRDFKSGSFSLWWNI